MAINKNFVVKNGLEVSTELIFADADTRRVGILNTQPQHSLHVVGGIGATNLTVSGVSTFSKPVGFGSDVDITGISTITGHVSIGKTTLLVVGDLDVTGNIKGGGVLDNITNLNISGIATVNEIYAAGGNVSVGLLTVTDAADISGDANLTGITTITNLQAGLATEFFAATGIQSGGVPIGGGVTTINFTGIGATLVEVFGTRADVYISGGPGISSVGIETSGAFVGTATTLNFIGPGVTVGVTSDNVAHVTVGLGSLGYTFRSFVNIGSPQDTFAFQYNRNAIEVYSNGLKLVQGSDYTATNGTTVSLAATAFPGDTVELVSYQAEVVNPLPGQVLRRQYTAGAGQTSFQFTGGYDIGNIDVFLNGSKLVESSDFTATDGLSFNIIGGTIAGDVIEAMTYPANIVGAGGSNFLFMDDDVPIGLASTVNFGYGIGVTGYDARVGIVTVGLTTNLNVPGTLTIGTLALDNLYVPGNAEIIGITTMGNVVVGGGTTDLLVSGNARVTGILSVGESTITLDPSTDTVTATSFVGGLTGSASSLSGVSSSFLLDYNNFTNTPTIPTNNNELTNGAGYITTSFTNTSQLTNDAGFITGVSTFSGDYNDLTNRPTIPTNNNTLTNGAGYITSADGGNADRLDNEEGSFYLNYNNFINTPAIPTNNNTLTNGAGYITSTPDDLNVAGIVTATGGFVSAANTTPIQISLVGNELTFTAVGIGSTTLTLS